MVRSPAIEANWASFRRKIAPSQGDSKTGFFEEKRLKKQGPGAHSRWIGARGNGAILFKSCINPGYRDMSFRHCERSEAIQCTKKELDWFVASLLGMTGMRKPASLKSPHSRRVR